MLAASLFALQLSAAAALGLAHNGTLGKGSITCGDGKGNTCGDNWNNAYCDSAHGVSGATNSGAGACCHDDFHVWCCPEGWKCSGTFNNPGTYCMTTTKHSSSCVCDTSAVPKVTKVTAVSDPKVVTASEVLGDNCCFNPDECEILGGEKFTNTQQVSWSTTTSFGTKMSVAEGAIFEKVTLEFDLSESISNGQQHTIGTEVDISEPCGCNGGLGLCNFPYIHLTYDLQVTTYVQEVQIEATNCGTTHTTSGTITKKMYAASAVCARWSCANLAQCQHDLKVSPSSYQCKTPTLEGVAGVAP